MGDLERIGVAIPADLLANFDAHIERHGYVNRSEAFRDLIRRTIAHETAEQPEARIVGTLTLVYDHHVRQLSDRLTAIQHDHHDLIISTLHVHLDHDLCLEVLVMKGPSGHVRAMADRLIATKGVQYGQLSVTMGV
jgi:CopG family transcriptional regulator, nickel-responsive regulator